MESKTSGDLALTGFNFFLQIIYSFIIVFCIIASLLVFIKFEYFGLLYLQWFFIKLFALGTIIYWLLKFIKYRVEDRAKRRTEFHNKFIKEIKQEVIKELNGRRK
jgi:hypothetical protein